MGGGSQGGIKSEINVTPLVDVVLVLLIIFMVVTPELQRGKEVKLPTANEAKQREKGDPIIVSIQQDGALWVEQEAVTKERLIERIKAEATREVLIKGDAGLKYGDVKGVINAIRNAGAKGVSLAAATEDGKK
jgi:biopolymer transport protein ExbD